MKKKMLTNVTQMLSKYRGAMMGLAALWVLLLHCWILYVPEYAVLGDIEEAVKTNGVLGVEIFFFYSGLGLSYAIRKHSLGTFYVNRIKRIVFPFFTMAVLYAVSESWSIEKLLRNALGVTFVLEDIFAFLWFVPAIAILYLIFPLYHRLMQRAGDKAAFTLCVLCVWLGAAIVWRDALRSDIWCMINRVPNFLIGVCVGEIGREKEIRFGFIHWSLCLLALAMGFELRSAANQGLIQAIKEPYFAAMIPIGVSLSLLFPGLFTAMEACGGWIKRLTGLMVRLLSFIGTFSLELYCVHQWLYGYIYSALEGRFSYLVINIVSLPVLVFAGWALGGYTVCFGRCGRACMRAFRHNKNERGYWEAPLVSYGSAAHPKKYGGTSRSARRMTSAARCSG